MADSFFNNDSQTESESDIPNLASDLDSAAGDSKEESEQFKSEEGRIAAVMSYIPFLCFIPLMNMKHNKEARFHARQGVMLFLIELVAALFLIDKVSNFVFTALLLVAVAFSVAGIVFALQGKNYKLPVISDLVEKSKL